MHCVQKGECGQTCGWWRYHHPVKMILVAYNLYMRRFAALETQTKEFIDILTPVGEKLIKNTIEKSTNCQSTSLLETLSTTVYSRNLDTGTQLCSVHDEGESEVFPKTMQVPQLFIQL